MSAIPLSFADFGETSLRPDCIVKCSYGNDSIALLQWLHEYQQKHPGSLGKVVVLYNNTGWATSWWPARVKKGEALSHSYDFLTATTFSIGMEELVHRHNAWPNSFMKFCTEELKIAPTLAWLAVHDPEGKAELICGVRREESFKRRNWPEYEESSDKNHGRPFWSPMVLITEAERNELINRAGWEVLPHRSRECRCVLGNSQDIKRWSEDDILDIERAEASLKVLKVLRGQGGEEDENQYMFRPSSKKGRPQGIRAVVEWAKAVDSKEEPNEAGGCDSGFCTG